MPKLDTILTFSGWAQNPSSLNHALPSSHQIINFDYTKFSSIDELIIKLENLPTPQIIVGHSLGGQIAARLIAKKILNPQKLILLSAPFQFVKSPKIAAAMPQNSFDIFRKNFAENSIETLEKFLLLSMLGSKKRAKELSDNLYLNDENYQNLLSWLDELGRFSCFDLNFNDFPETLIIHGSGDMVVNSLQAKVFNEKISHSTVKILANCGHLPHISDLSQTSNFISEFIQSK